MNPTPPRNPCPRLAAAVLLLVAAALRLAGINDQLWLDEIWSINQGRKAKSVYDILFALHHDNNHWLNTMYVHYLGPGRPWWSYHVFPELCGIGTVFVGWLLARRNWCALLLLAGCDFLVEYSTEARGYAPEGFFAVLCLWLLQLHLARPRRWTAAVMSCSAVLGVLSHLTFVVILAGWIVAGVLGLRTAGRRWLDAILRPILWAAAPLLMLAALYFGDVRYMIRGGGPPTPTDLPVQAAGMVLGMSFDTVWEWRAAAAAGIAVLALCALALWRQFRARQPGWPIYAAAWAMVPALLLFWPRTDYIHPRYLYVATPFLLVLLGIELHRWIGAARFMRLAAILGIAAYCLVNAISLTRFLTLGKGDYLGALKLMLNLTPERDVIIGAPQHPISTLMVAQYYDWYHTHSPHALMTIKDPEWGDQWPQWVIEEVDVGPELQASANGALFHRVASFPVGAATSGIPWTIYESDTLAPRILRPQSLETLSH